MNKKVIAMAVAAGLVAPLAAQAETKMSGRVQQEIVNQSAGLSFEDNGHARLQFDYSDDSGFFGRLAMDARVGREDAGEHRDQYVGLKVGGGKLSFGRQAGVIKNIEKDPFIATFLQMRGGAVAGGSFGSSSFIDDTIKYSMKLGGGKLGVEYVPTGSGHMGLALTGGGDLKYYVGYNTDGGSGNTNMKAGIRMPMGGMKLRVGLDDDAGTQKINLGVGMKMGGGLLDVTFATLGADNTNPYYRVAYKKKNSSNVSTQAGLIQNGSTASNDMAIGVGVTVKF
ncbi:MAG: porin [Gammaproteobacteria bacterium]|nr:porin [Gammaproteobacteria bacterium]